MTRIVAPFWPLASDSNSGLSQAISILCQMELHLLSVFLLLLVSWQGLYLARGCIWPRAAGLTSLTASEVTRIVAPFWPLAFIGVLTGIMPPPQAISILSYICSCLLLMVSWQVPYPAKGCSLDFNNGLSGDSNSGPISPAFIRI